MDRESLTLLLAQRLLDLYGKETLSAILADIKSRPGVSRRAFRSAGNAKELLDAIPKAVEVEHALPERLAAAIDQIEENGAQHIFLFKFKSGGRGGLNPRTFAEIAGLPNAPAPSLYTGIPSSPRLYRRESDDELTLKQIRRATYQELDHETEESGGGRTIHYRQVETRAVNLLRLDFGRGEAEIRIDRARDRQDDDLAGKLFSTFVRDLSDTFDVWESFEPIPVWKAFSRILAARDETHMSTENALDESMRIRLASRREEDKGMDVRDHKSYVEKASRKSLRIYWNVPTDSSGAGDEEDEQEESPARLHTVISSLEVTAAGDEGAPVLRHRVGKVYVAARTSPKKLEHVIARIRHFTS